MRGRVADHGALEPGPALALDETLGGVGDRARPAGVEVAAAERLPDQWRALLQGLGLEHHGPDAAFGDLQRLRDLERDLAAGQILAQGDLVGTVDLGYAPGVVLGDQLPLRELRPSAGTTRRVEGASREFRGHAPNLVRPSDTGPGRLHEGRSHWNPRAAGLQLRVIPATLTSVRPFSHDAGVRRDY
ncbi:hypothetical protein GCM10009725_02360 [Aeromicrobium tamlense]